MDLSPATVRNVMADLEELGLVISPHTSAGRIPTVSGYRLFVDSLLTLRPLENLELGQLRGQLEVEQDPATLLSSASNLLSDLTHMAGVVMMPRRERLVFRQIEFMPLSGDQVLAILVTNEQEIVNRIVNTKRSFSRSELEQASNYLTATFKGQTLTGMREKLLKELQEVRSNLDQSMAQALEMAGQVFQGQGSDDDCVISGQTNLMDFNELADMQRLRQLFDAFTYKHDILHLLDQCAEAQGIQIFIGEESGHRSLDSCSVITAPYGDEDGVVGVLGVIGPTRMAYDRVIPIVDVTAKLLSAALKQQ